MTYDDVPEQLREQLVAQFDQRIAEDPLSPWSDFFRSEIDLLHGRVAAAEARLNDLAIHEDPNVRCHAFQALGQLRQFDNQPHEALALFERAALLEERPGYSLVRQADIHADIGNAEQAEHIYRTVLSALTADDGVTALALAGGLAKLLDGRGRRAEAAEILARLVQRYPERAELEVLLDHLSAARS